MFLCFIGGFYSMSTFVRLFNVFASNYIASANQEWTIIAIRFVRLVGGFYSMSTLVRLFNVFQVNISLQLINARQL